MAQTYQAVVLSEGYRIAYTPSGSAVAAGAVVVQGELVGYATQDIPVGVLGGLHITGMVRVVKINGALTVGTVIYWDADGNPQGGTGGTGGATSAAGAGVNKEIGVVIKAAGATDEAVEILAQPASPVSA